MKNATVLRPSNPFSNPCNQLRVEIIWQVCVCVALLLHSSPRNISTWASSWLSSWSCRWSASFCSSRSNSSKEEARLVPEITKTTQVWRPNTLRNLIYCIFPVWVTHSWPFAWSAVPCFSSRVAGVELQASSQATVALLSIDSSRALTKSSQWRLTSGAWIRISI